MPAVEWHESVDVPGALPATAREWGERLFSPRPLLVRVLIAVRNLVVRPFGVEPFGSLTDAGERSGSEFLGPFRVIEETPERIDFGISDKHLSFRSSLASCAGESGTRVTVRTTVDAHNSFGRVYAGLLRLGHPLVMRIFLNHLSRNERTVPRRR